MFCIAHSMRPMLSLTEIDFLGKFGSSHLPKSAVVSNLRADYIACNVRFQGFADSCRLRFDEFNLPGRFGRDSLACTFRWDSESAQIAHVHCVIVGFSCAPNAKPRIIFDDDKKKSRRTSILTRSPRNTFVRGTGRGNSKACRQAADNIPIDSCAKKCPNMRPASPLTRRFITLVS